MSVPDEYSVFCDRCDGYNLSQECCICKTCTERIINDWVDNCDKLFETSDIDDLKKRFGIVVNDEVEGENG